LRNHIQLVKDREAMNDLLQKTKINVGLKKKKKKKQKKEEEKRRRKRRRRKRKRRRRFILVPLLKIKY